MKTHRDPRTATTTHTSVLEHPMNRKVEAFIKYMGKKQADSSGNGEDSTLYLTNQNQNIKMSTSASTTKHIREMSQYFEQHGFDTNFAVDVPYIAVRRSPQQAAHYLETHTLQPLPPVIETRLSFSSGNQYTLSVWIAFNETSSETVELEHDGDWKRIQKQMYYTVASSIIPQHPHMGIIANCLEHMHKRLQNLEHKFINKPN